MVLDLAETPILGRLEINGRLTFKNDMDINLRSKLIWVRKGQFIIGSAAVPYEYKGKITLYGDQDSETLVVSPSITAGNKVLANTGVLEIYGKERSRAARLQLPVNAGDTTLYLDNGLDWVAGDKIYLAPTAMQHDHSDYAEIATYDSASGIATVTTGLSFYHFGGDSTVADYGLDMRGEVVLLTRNVLIQGFNEDNWGGQLLTTDIIDGSQFQSGQTTIKNAEFYRMGQRDNTRAAIRFEGTFQLNKLIENVVAHTSTSWNMKIIDSQKVTVTNFSSIGSKSVGIAVDRSSNVFFDKAYIFDVSRRENVNEEYLGGFLFCIYASPKTGSACSNVKVNRSIAAGCVGAGFVAPGHQCD